MIWNRGNQDDFNAWASFGNDGWAWSDVLPYFQKSETYTPTYYANQSEQLVTFNSRVHGFNGPTQVSYPGSFGPHSDNWVHALRSLNIPEVLDPNEGLSAGGFYLPSTSIREIKPNQTQDVITTILERPGLTSRFGPSLSLLGSCSTMETALSIAMVKQHIRNFKHERLLWSTPWVQKRHGKLSSLRRRS
jgi:choline dehydrogenase-like flavoprotein